MTNIIQRHRERFLNLDPFLHLPHFNRPASCTPCIPLRIQDLQAMIGPLKNALSDQRLKAKALVDVRALEKDSDGFGF